MSDIEIKELEEVKRYIKKKLREIEWSYKCLAEKSGVSKSFIDKLLSSSVNGDFGYKKIKKLLDTLKFATYSEFDTVNKIMTSIGSVKCVSKGATLFEAAKIMGTEYDQLPVFDGGKFIGVITISHLAEALASGKDARKERVEMFISDDYEFVLPDTPIPVAAEKLLKKQILIVSEKGRILGIVTKSDINDYIYRKIEGGGYEGYKYHVS